MHTTLDTALRCVQTVHTQHPNLKSVINPSSPCLHVNAEAEPLTAKPKKPHEIHLSGRLPLHSAILTGNTDQCLASTCSYGYDDQYANVLRG